MLELVFGSLLTYSPRGTSVVEQDSRTWKANLKGDLRLPSPYPPILTSEYISNEIKQRIATLPFADLFRNKPILVPILNSAWMKPETIWVPQRLANALVQNGLGVAVEDKFLTRVTWLRKSSTSPSSNRPTAAEHYDSLRIQKGLPEPKEILLVDDVITRGATTLGTANRPKDAFPEAHIQGFAAMRTISNSPNFKATNDPCLGKITLNKLSGETFRDP